MATEHESSLQLRESQFSPEGKTFRLCKLTDKKDFPKSIPLLVPPEYAYDSKTYSVKRTDCSGDTAIKPEFILTNESVEILRQIKKPIAVVAICGPGRSGKSFFLSRLLGDKDVFKPGHSQKACTRGIWLSTTALVCDEYTLLFLDSEGTGAVGEGETAKETSMAILTLTNLLSSFLIYNSKKVPNKGDLKDLSMFGELSARIVVQDCQSRETRKLGNYLPHFFWLLRDVPTDWLPTSEKSMTSYVKKILEYQSEDSEAGIGLSSLYPDLECFGLPHPGCGKGKNAVYEEKLGKDFVDTFKDIAKHVLRTVQQKKGYSSQPIDGPTLASLAQQYVKAINTPGAVPNLEQCWKTASMQKIYDLVDHFVRTYSKEMDDTLSGQYPLEYDIDPSESEKTTLLAIHHSILKEKVLLPFKLKCSELLCLTEEALTQDDIFKSAVETLQTRIALFEDSTNQVIEGEFLEFTDRNRQESEKACRDSFWSVCRSYEPLSIDNVQKAYFEKAVGPAKDDVYDELFREIPERPKDIQVTNRTYNSATIKWVRPNNYVGNTFQYQVSINSEIFLKDPAAEELTHPFFKCENLTPATEYTVTVHAINKKLLGEGAKIRFKTEAGPPNKPSNVTVSTMKESLTQIKVSFEQPTEVDGNGSDITKVVAKYGIMTSSENLNIIDVPIEDIDDGYICILIDNVETHEDIQIQLSFENEIGEGESVKLFFNTKLMIPGPPEGFMVVGRGHERIKLRWEPPSINPGAVSRYAVYQTKMKCKTDIICLKETSTEKSTFSAVAKNLDSDSKYNFEVKALNCEDIGTSTGEFQDWIQTKYHPTIRATIVTGAAVGGTLAGPAIVAVSLPIASGVIIKKGLEKNDAKQVAAGVAGIVTSPVTATAGLVTGTVGAPVVGGVLAKNTYDRLDSDSDLADSDNETDPVYRKRQDKKRGLERSTQP